MDVSVLFVAPFASLYDTARQVIDEQFADKMGRIEVIKGDLDESLVTVKNAVEGGVQVIVSRGGTGKLIDEHVDVPVVFVRVSLVDVVKILMTQGRGYDKVGIAGFKNVIYGSEEIGQCLGIELVEIPLQGEAEAVEKIAKAIADGVQFIIGDAVAVKVARRLGIAGEIISSGREAVFAALKEALLLAEIRREEQERSAVLRSVIAQSTDGIVVTDAAGCITMINSQAEKIFKLSSFEAAGKPLSRVLPELKTEQAKLDDGYFDDFTRIGDKSFVVKRSALGINNEAIGEVFSLQNISQLQKIERNVRKKLHQKGLIAKNHMTDIIGSSPACLEMKRKASKYALTDSTILVTGESGTGKEILVQSIHNASLRSDGPFVAVNCAALPENLLESELFGYEEGAFTGAKRGGRQGLFELAHGGTIFLDEIGEMPMALQSRLLRVLQEKEIMHIGGDSIIPIDVRVIAATNQNLVQMVENKTFREDLYYRLNILRIQMPSLEMRQADIPLLARELVRKMKMLNPQITGIDLSATEYLQRLHWPGNIRQLSNVMERAMLLSEETVITRRGLIATLDSSENPAAPASLESAASPNESVRTLAELEYDTLQQVLEEENFNFSRAAARLGIHRTTLWRRMRKKK